MKGTQLEKSYKQTFLETRPMHPTLISNSESRLAYRRTQGVRGSTWTSLTYTVKL